jgi:hypothetical protein
MKNSRRIIAAFVCAVALLALPAQAAPAPGDSPTAGIQLLGTWFRSLWDGLVGLILGSEEPPAPDLSEPPTLDLGDGGSCIDPNGCNH